MAAERKHIPGVRIGIHCPLVVRPERHPAPIQPTVPAHRKPRHAAGRPKRRRRPIDAGGSGMCAASTYWNNAPARFRSRRSATAFSGTTIRLFMAFGRLPWRKVHGAGWRIARQFTGDAFAKSSDTSRPNTAANRPSVGRVALSPAQFHLPIRIGRFPSHLLALSLRQPDLTRIRRSAAGEKATVLSRSFTSFHRE